MRSLSAALLLLFVWVVSTAAQTDVETIDLKGDKYTVSKKLPSEIIGTYYYEGDKEPIVRIDSDGTGVFQPHMMKPIPITIWIDVDEKGVPRREIGSPERYRYTLLIRYGDGGGGNYKKDTYDLLDVTMSKDRGVASILGERIRKLD